MPNAGLRRMLFVGRDPALWIAAHHAEAAGGAAVRVCGSPAEARLQVADAVPDLILLDAAAVEPPATLAGAMEALRLTPEGREIPLVLLAADAPPGEASWRDLQAAAVILRPVEPGELAARMREIWEALATAPWVLEGEGRGFQRQFVERLPARVDEVEEAWRQARASGWNGESLVLLHRLAHSLAGAGAMFGLADVAVAARAMERLLRSPASPPGPEAQRRLAALLHELRRAAGQTV